MNSSELLLYHNISKKVEISESDFYTFLSFTERITVKRNDFFINQGSTPKKVAFVLSGFLHTYHLDENGDKQVVQLAAKEHWVSDLYSFFSKEQAYFNIQAIDKAELLILSKENFEKVCKEIPVFERFFRILIQNAYVALLKRVSNIYGNTAEERYEAFLKTHANIANNVPQHYIASYLGIKPQSLSRIRKHLTSKD